MMYSLWNMNAVTTLLLVLIVAVTNCGSQQDLLKQPDEDLFFPESLLVNPDKSTGESDDYNSLEAPKEDDENGLVKTKPTNRVISIYDLSNAVVIPSKSTDSADEYNSLEVSKENYGQNEIAKPEPRNNVISIYDLANAVVLPSRSQKRHLDHSYFRSSEEVSNEEDSRSSEEIINEEDSRDTREVDNYEDDVSEEGSATHEGSGRPHFNWDLEGSGDEYGSGEVDSSEEVEGSGYHNVGQEDYGDSIDFLVEADLEEFIPIKTVNVSADIDSQFDVEYDDDYDDDDDDHDDDDDDDVEFDNEEDNIKIYSSPSNNLVIHGYGGSTIGEMAKIDFLENEMHQVKGQISQLSARMEQQSNDIGHLQMIIIQLQEQINTLIYRQHHLRD